MYIDQRVLGLLCLIGGIALTFFYPLGQRRGNHLLGEILLLILFTVAAYNLVPTAWVPNDLVVLAIGFGVGLLAVVYRDFRRFLRYFQGKFYRMSHPYYWYSRMYRRRRRNY
jgi:ABC-type polysaccharide/polyol phosphate export permease